MSNNLNQRLKTAQEQLSTLLQGDNLSPSQQMILSNIFADLSVTSTELQVTLEELYQKHQELAQRAKQEQLVGAIAQRIRRSLNLQEILNTVATEVRQVLQVDQVVVYRFKASGDAIGVTAAVDSAWDRSGQGTVPQMTSSDALSFYSQSTLHKIDNIDDIESGLLPPHLREWLHQHQVKALLIAPLMGEGQPLGLICVHQCTLVRQWQSFELDLLYQLADQVAIALQHSDLYHQVQQLNTELEQQVQLRTDQVQKALGFESMLKRITDRVRDSLDENHILQTVVEELTLVLELGGCNSAIYNLEQGTSTICYEYTNSIPAYQGRVVHMEHFPEIYSQLKQRYSFQFCSLLPNPVRGSVTMLACPIFVDSSLSQGGEQAVLGDLWLIHHKNHVFNEFEIRLVQQVANQCAIAIRQARLYQAAQVQVQELEKLNRLKDEFLSTVSHELRTPITNVKMAIHMLKIAPTEDRRQRCLDILEAETAREAELIDELLDLQRLEAASHPIVLERTYPQDWLSEVIEPFRSRLATQQQTLEINCPSNLPPLVSDLVILRRILSELLNNACKYTPAGHPILLDVYAEPPITGESSLPITIFRIRNQAEIPRAELPHIFEKFYRVIQSDRYKQGGTGLGLALVQKRIEQLGGTIQVESAEGWTTFTIQLPSL